MGSHLKPGLKDRAKPDVKMRSYDGKTLSGFAQRMFVKFICQEIYRK